MANHYPWENYAHFRPNQISIWAERYFLKGTFHFSDTNPTYLLPSGAVASAHFFRVTPHRSPAALSSPPPPLLPPLQADPAVRSPHTSCLGSAHLPGPPGIGFPSLPSPRAAPKCHQSKGALHAAHSRRQNHHVTFHLPHSSRKYFALLLSVSISHFLGGLAPL